DERKFNIVKDHYGFPDVLGTDPHGWYLRGLNTHNPEFTEVADDMESMLEEIKRRIFESNGKIKKIICCVFAERHPKLKAVYEKSFENWAIAMLELEILQRVETTSNEERGG
ncbi:MAG: hypothetical protein Q8T08_22050, partial [Ignavibacteria bacterium]|nr:hypothetical protein [Ignavibacteria bacterium]